MNPPAHKPSLWPALDLAIAATRGSPGLRTGSLIVTLYGDAILPRGGALAIADLLVLMHRFGLSDTVVRTAISRLAAEGVLVGTRHGRRSAYALTPRAEAQFRAAIPRIYGPLSFPWDGHLHLSFPEPGTDRTQLDQAGFSLLAPGVLLATNATPSPQTLAATGDLTVMRRLAARTWPLGDIRTRYDQFLDTFSPIERSLSPQEPPRREAPGKAPGKAPGEAQDRSAPTSAPRSVLADLSPLDALAARTLLIHAWRRITLRDPRLPEALLPPDWPGRAARTLCATLDQRLQPKSEIWLDTASNGQSCMQQATPGRTRFA